MAQELPFKSADEQDALSGWRKVIKWRNGARKKTKRRYRRRVRAWAKLKLRGEAHE